MKKEDVVVVAFFYSALNIPFRLARMVMEKTPHRINGRSRWQKFALDNGIKLESKKCRPKQKSRYKEWLKKSEYQTLANIENHTPLNGGMDASGNLSALYNSGLV